MSELFHTTVGQGPRIVLLHGWGMNAGVWEPFLPLLHDYQVTLVELPGHGNSPWNDSDVTLQHWVENVLEVAPERATWCGWSLGGQVAQLAAMQEPDRVSALVLLSSTPRFVQGPGWQHAVQQQVFHQFGEQLLEDTESTLQRFLSLQVRGSESARGILKQLRESMASRPKPNLAALKTGLDLLLDTDLTPSMSQLSQPSLWLWSRREHPTPG